MKKSSAVILALAGILSATQACVQPPQPVYSLPVSHHLTASDNIVKHKESGIMSHPEYVAYITKDGDLCDGMAKDMKKERVVDYVTCGIVGFNVQKISIEKNNDAVGKAIYDQYLTSDGQIISRIPLVELGEDRSSFFNILSNKSGKISRAAADVLNKDVAQEGEIKFSNVEMIIQSFENVGAEVDLDILNRVYRKHISSEYFNDATFVIAVKNGFIERYAPGEYYLK